MGGGRGPDRPRRKRNALDGVAGAGGRRSAGRGYLRLPDLLLTAESGQPLPGPARNASVIGSGDRSLSIEIEQAWCCGDGFTRSGVVSGNKQGRFGMSPLESLDPGGEEEILAISRFLLCGGARAK